MRREAGIILAAVLALGLNGAAFAANQVAGNTGSTPLNLNDGKTLTINGQGGVSTAISQGATEGDVVVTITISRSRRSMCRSKALRVGTKTTTAQRERILLRLVRTQKLKLTVAQQWV